MSLLNSHQLKIVTYKLKYSNIKLEWRHSRRAPRSPSCIRRSHSTQIFHGSHSLNIFAEQLISNVWKGPECQRHCQISSRSSTNMLCGSNVWYPPVGHTHSYAHPLDCFICAKDIIIMLLLKMMEKLRVVHLCKRLGRGQGLGIIFSYFLFCFSAVFNCSFMAGTR